MDLPYTGKAEHGIYDRSAICSYLAPSAGCDKLKSGINTHIQYLVARMFQLLKD